MVSSPGRLALAVRRYHITISWHDFMSPLTSAAVDTLRKAQNTVFNRLSRSLPLMTKLLVLQLHTEKNHWVVSGNSGPPSLSSILRKCTFRLEVFHCSYSTSDKSNSSCYRDWNLLQEFLPNQTDVRHLWIHNFRRSPNTSIDNTPQQLALFKTVCPSVVSVGGTSGIVVDILLVGR